MTNGRKLNTKLSATRDLLERDRTLQMLLSPLGDEKSRVMGDLLESVKTAGLEKAYNKYLPAVLNEGQAPVSRGRKVLSEDVKTERTGNRAERAHEGNDEVIVDEINNMKRLAGLQ